MRNPAGMTIFTAQNKLYYKTYNYGTMTQQAGLLSQLFNLIVPNPVALRPVLFTVLVVSDVYALYQYAIYI